MSERPLEPRARLAVKHTTRWARAVVDELRRVVDMAHARGRARARAARAERPRGGDAAALGAARVDPYAENRATGAFVLVDEATNETVGAGMVVSAAP